MTESPRRNILLMNRSLLAGVAFFFPLPFCTVSVQTCGLVLGEKAIVYLAHILKDHVKVAIKGLDAGQKFPVIATGDEHLGVILDCSR